MKKGEKGKTDQLTLKRSRAAEKKARQRARKSSEAMEKVQEKDRKRKSKPEEKEKRKNRDQTEEAKERDRKRKSKPEEKEKRKNRNQTEEAKERDRERKSKPEEKDKRKSRDQTDEARQRDRERKSTPEEKDKRKSRDQTDEARQRDKVRKQHEREAMLADERAVMQERDNLRKKLKKKLNDTKVQPKDGLRTKDIFDGSLIVPLLEKSKDAIGRMNVKCADCGAFKFKKESAGFCCLNGKVLPKVFPRPPDQLMKLWTEDGRIPRLFRAHTRELNNALCLSSIKVQQKTFGNFTPSVIFQGQMKHYAGPLLPNEGSKPKFAQLYCFDPALESAQRFANMYVPPNLSKTQKENLKGLLEDLQKLIHKHNPFVKDFLMILEMEDDRILEGKIVISAAEKPLNEHPRRYNAPLNYNEVSILTNEKGNHDLVLHKRGGGVQEISDLNPRGMPMHFTLLFPTGHLGWNQAEKHTDGRRRITTREFYNFHLQLRDNQNENFLHRARRLFQEFCCMGWVIVENQRLNYAAMNQKELRADTYKNVKELSEPRADAVYGDDHQAPGLGRKVLPSSHTGGPRYMNKQFQDAMAIAREHHKPDFFITMTCNPQWPEIKDELLPGETPQDRPDLITRVFKLKQDQLMHDIVKGELFGKVVAHMKVYEWQKRSLPHVHILIIRIS